MIAATSDAGKWDASSVHAINPPALPARDGRGGGVDVIIACSILDPIAGEEVIDDRVVFRTMKHIACGASS